MSLLIMILLSAGSAHADYSLDRAVISSGGSSHEVTVSTTNYAHDFTAGQSSAVGVSSAGNYENVGGFWGATIRSQQCLPWPQGVVAWWRAEGNANDTVGGHDGTFNGSISAGYVGMGFSFNGTDSYISIPIVSTQTDNFAIEAWIKWDGGATDQVIYAAGNPVSYAILVRFDGSLIVANGGASPLRTNASVIVNNSQWQHVVVARSSGTWVAYVDGVSRTFVEGNPSQSPTVSPANNAYIGGTGVSGTFFHGGIDELVFYSGAFTAEQAAILYASGKLGHCRPGANQNKFSFDPVKGAGLNQWIPSNEIRVPNLPFSVPIRIDACESTACEYSLDHGVTWTPAPGMVSAGNQVMVREISSGSFNGATSMTLNMGGMTSTFSVTADNTIHMLTVSLAGAGTGRVTSNPSGINCGTDCTELYGNRFVTLTASYDSSAYSVTWTGACNSNSDTCDVLMDDNKAVTATFSPQPDTRFFGSPVSGEAPLLVQFTDSSINNPTSWSWNFGDPGAGTADNTSTVKNPSHIYRAPGQYTVTMETLQGIRTLTNYIVVSGCSNDPVKISSGAHYATLQSGYDVSNVTDTIDTLAVVLPPGDMIMNNTQTPKNITLVGGYNCNFNGVLDLTEIQGRVEIEGGSLTVDGIIIK